MARIRSIKPEFWTAEQVMELTRDARLMFVGLWNFCDDAGVHPASTKTLKAEVFPADDITSSDVRRMIDECIAQGLVIEYSVENRSYWQITGWHHQKIDQPTYKHPTPDGKVPEGAAKRRSEKPKESMADQKNTTNTSRTFAEQSANTSRTFAECSPPESSRVESTGKEVNHPTVIASSPLSTEDAREKPVPGTRKGKVCGLLRQAGMSDAAPHYLDDATWDRILGKRTDEEIVEVAKAKMAARPGQRTGLKYIAPALLEDPQAIAISGQKPRQTIHDQREAVSIALTGRKPTHERQIADPERDITGESVRVA